MKDLKDKLAANKWVYWFVSVSIISYISTQINKKNITEILFAEYYVYADLILETGFFIMMVAILVKWYKKHKKSKQEVV